MTAAARSMNVFAFYLLGLSVVLLVAPNTLLQAFGLPPTSEVWIRVVGMLVAFLGLYYRPPQPYACVAATPNQALGRAPRPLLTILLRTAAGVCAAKALRAKEKQEASTPCECIHGR